MKKTNSEIASILNREIRASSSSLWVRVYNALGLEGAFNINTKLSVSICNFSFY